MSGWQSAVLDDYLASVTEREFDAPFITLLWAKGFSDVHQLHGAFEFGKDFIAKRDGEQWAFQTKAGNIGLGSWRQIRSQVDEMLLDEIAHPNFDTNLRRRAVLVTTGRLVGGAPLQAQQYRTALATRLKSVNGGQPSFDLWDREVLLEDLKSIPSLSLDLWDREQLGKWLGLISDIDRRTATMASIEQASSAWSSSDRHRVILAAAICAHLLATANRPDLAARVGLALARSGAERIHRGELDAGTLAADAGRLLFGEYAMSLLDAVEAIASDPEALYLGGDEPIAGLTYRVRCSSSIELVGQLGLLLREAGDQDGFHRVADVLERFVKEQPGAAHPISDRWAVSLIPAAIVLLAADRSVLKDWLSRVVVWTCDRYEEAPGLASVFATEEEEIAQIVGDPYEHLDIRPRQSSYLATVVLDLASVLEIDDLYDDAFNDFAAVGVALPVVEPLDGPGQFDLSGESIVVEPNVLFDPESGDKRGGEWRRAVHHRRTPREFKLDAQGRSWEMLSCSLLLRDRHFLTATRHLAGMDG